MVKETYQNGWQQKNNNGKYGFFPTPLEVVNMEMSLIDFSSVPKDLPISICDFTGGTGEQLYTMHKYIKAIDLNPVSYYNEITRERYEKALELYGEVENMNFLNTDFFYMRCRFKNGNSQTKDNIAIVRNNPPYTWLEVRGQNIRAEDIFFIDNTTYNCQGGIQIFELPIHQLIEQPNLLRKIFYRYENVNIFRFPEEIFKNYKQVVVMGVKKKDFTNDIALADTWLERLRNNAIESLDEIAGTPIYFLTEKAVKKCKEINIFRDGRVNDNTLTNGLNEVLDSLLEKELQKEKSHLKIMALKETPIIEKLIGHRAVELNAGAFNGIMGNVLVEGGSYKKIHKIETTDGDKDITEEIEIISPYIEITNKSGDIIFKDN